MISELFSLPGQYICKKNCWRLSRNICVLCQQCLWHTSTFCQGLWFGFLMTVEIICSIGEHIIQCRKNSVLNIEQCVKTKVNNINWEWWKKAGRGWSKKNKRLTDKQVSTKDFTWEKKVMQLVKPINYWEIPANAWRYNIIFYNLMLYMLYIISSGLNQVHLIKYTTKLETFLLDPIFKKYNMFSSNYQICFMKNTNSKF